MSEPARQPTLVRALRLPHATALVVGTIIGASIFVQPAEIGALVPSVAGTLSVWLLCGLLTLCGALVCAALAARYQESGGVYVYLRELFGRPFGFLWGWAMFWSIHSGVLAAMATIFARYTGYLVPLSQLGERVVAVGVLVVLSAVNYFGVRPGGRLQLTFTVLKVAGVALVIALGVALGGRVEEHFVAPEVAGPVSAGAFLSAMVAGLFAYGGWHIVTFSAGETVDARRTVPRALMIGTLTVTVAYLAMNAVYLYVLPLETVASSTRVAADLADALLGRGGGVGVALLVLLSVFGALAGVVLAGPRVYWAMARDGLLFRWLGEVHESYRTPHHAIVLQAAWASVLVVTGSYRMLVSRVIYTEWLFFALLAAGLFVLRRREPGRPLGAWGHPAVPIVFALAALTIVGNEVLQRPRESLFGLGLVAAGVPVYLAWRWLGPGNAQRRRTIIDPPSASGETKSKGDEDEVRR